jgi:2-oxoisovalerate dehydrogenase E2 component (dihydrolipoyl transacylase)
VLQVGSPLIRIETNADAPATTEQSDPREPQPPETPAPEAPEALEPPVSNGHKPASAADAATTEQPASTDSRTPRAATAAPAVRQRASSLGIDLQRVAGTGPDGRVVHADLDAHLTKSNGRTHAAPTVEPDDDTVDDVPIIGLRRNIAQRMQLSKSRIPHFTYVDEIDVTDVERLRAELNRQHDDRPNRLTILPFLMRATIVALRDFPQMNARYDDDNGVVHRHRSVHLGVATQTPKGLMVPVVMHAEARDLWGCADEVGRLSAAARDNKITIAELTGSTITISSLGALGGIVSTPIINYPEVAIIGVNKISTRPTYVGDVVLPRHVMNLSSSFDHRVVDGADAAAFIQRIRVLLETPALLFTS